MSAKDRKSIGQKSEAEAATAHMMRGERAEQNLFASWLHRHELDGELTWNRPASHVKSTIRSGWPDFVVHRNGKTVYIEFKSKGEYLSREQECFKHRLEKQQIPHYICYSSQEAISVVQVALYNVR